MMHDLLKEPLCKLAGKYNGGVCRRVCHLRSVPHMGGSACSIHVETLLDAAMLSSMSDVLSGSSAESALR